MRTAHHIHNPCPPTTTARIALPALPRRGRGQRLPNKTRDVVVHLAQRTGVVSAATLTVRPCKTFLHNILSRKERRICKDMPLQT